ncbi:hypothetical protein SDC9_148306 [bioreactor metagenome]|uniref:Uncharacterized protein n=1 Tax=bioreactor metagenome TaxID=1076179 RepID=A0A645EKL9_9ZZZZ
MDGGPLDPRIILYAIKNNACILKIFENEICYIFGSIALNINLNVIMTDASLYFFSMGTVLLSFMKSKTSCFRICANLAIESALILCTSISICKNALNFESGSSLEIFSNISTKLIKE